MSIAVLWMWPPGIVPFVVPMRVRSDSDPGRGSRTDCGFKLRLAASLPASSAASLPGTSTCAGIHHSARPSMPCSSSYPTPSLSVTKLFLWTLLLLLLLSLTTNPSFQKFYSADEIIYWDYWQCARGSKRHWTLFNLNETLLESDRELVNDVRL